MKCDDCGEKFTSKRLLMEHLEWERDESNQTAETCADQLELLSQKPSKNKFKVTHFKSDVGFGQMVERRS